MSPGTSFVGIAQSERRGRRREGRKKGGWSSKSEREGEREGWERVGKVSGREEWRVSAQAAASLTTTAAALAPSALGGEGREGHREQRTPERVYCERPRRSAWGSYGFNKKGAEEIEHGGGGGGGTEVGMAEREY
eukprot:scaffold233504_cov33-Tisochrysis_lutea.AAC.1